jgi:probable phosphoglycerate mutase
MRLLIVSRHGHSLLNLKHLVNGDPARDPGLSPLGIEQAEQLTGQLAGIALDLVVVSEFRRTQQTAELAVAGREVPTVVEPGLDDVRIGELEGKTVDDYRAWKAEHMRSDPFPGGESLDNAAERYAEAFARLLERPEDTILCVCHEIPVRYLVNAAGGSDDLDRPLHDVPNAAPYVFDAAALERGVKRLRRVWPR